MTDLWNLALRRFVLRSGLCHRHLRRDTVFELQFDKPERFGIIVRGIPCDSQLFVQRQQIDILGHDIRDDRKQGGTTGLLNRPGIGLGRFRQTTDPAPEIDFPARADTGLTAVLRVGYPETTAHVPFWHLY